PPRRGARAPRRVAARPRRPGAHHDVAGRRDRRPLERPAQRRLADRDRHPGPPGRRGDTGRVADAGPGRLRPLRPCADPAAGARCAAAGARGRLPRAAVLPAAPPTPAPAAFSRFARPLPLLLVLDALRQDPERGGLFGDPDPFAALLHTLAPEGLALPATIRVALDRGLVPSDPAGDPDMDEIQRYWRTQSDLAALASYGLLHREITPDGQENRWRGTLEAVVEIFGALEMADDPDATR